MLHETDSVKPEYTSSSANWNILNSTSHKSLGSSILTRHFHQCFRNCVTRNIYLLYDTALIIILQLAALKTETDLTNILIFLQYFYILTS